MVDYVRELLEKTGSLPEGEIKGFLRSYLPLREMVYAMLMVVSEEKLDYKPADKEDVADLRDCFSELPRVEWGRVLAFESGVSRRGAGKVIMSPVPKKEGILEKMEMADRKLFEVISGAGFDKERVIEKYDENGVKIGETKAIWWLWGLRNHENMHLGMIRRDLDAIGVDPPEEYVKYWYG
jgi:hypothetical protein